MTGDLRNAYSDMPALESRGLMATDTEDSCALQERRLNFSMNERTNECSNCFTRSFAIEAEGKSFFSTETKSKLKIAEIWEIWELVSGKC